MEETIILHAHGSADLETKKLPDKIKLLFPANPKKRASLCTTPYFFKNMCARKPEFIVESGKSYPNLMITFKPRINEEYPNGIYDCSKDKVVQLDLDDGINGKYEVRLSEVIEFVLQAYPGRLINLWVSTCAVSEKRDLRPLKKPRSTDVTEQSYYNNKTGETLTGYYDQAQAMVDINNMNYRLSERNGHIWKSNYDKAKAKNDSATSITFAELKHRYGWDDEKAMKNALEVQELRKSIHQQNAGKRKTKRIRAKVKH